MSFVVVAGAMRNPRGHREHQTHDRDFKGSHVGSGSAARLALRPSQPAGWLSGSETHRLSSRTGPDDLMGFTSFNPSYDDYDDCYDDC